MNISKQLICKQTEACKDAKRSSVSGEEIWGAITAISNVGLQSQKVNTQSVKLNLNVKVSEQVTLLNCYQRSI